MAIGIRGKASRHGKPITGRKPRPLRCEHLEERLAMYSATGSSWSDANVSFSFVPDGTSSDGYTSTLFSKLDAVAPRDVWQREFARALQTWSNVSNLNFHLVADSGTPSGGSGAQGDIRLAAIPNGGSLAYAYYPSTSYTIGGDVFLATEYAFHVGSDYDLYSVLLHETGHSLGLGHSAGSVMNSYYQGVLPGLTNDDVAGIRSLYGTRSEDAFDIAGRNDSLGTASQVLLDSSGIKSFSADLTSFSDVDYYKVIAPADADGTLLVSVDSRDISLLQGRTVVYDSSGIQIGAAEAATYEGKAEIALSGVVPGQSYFIAADGAPADAFGMGKYQFSLAFGRTGGSLPPASDPPPADISADRYELNETLAAATDLGKLNSRTEAGLTLHSASDTDTFAFTAKTTGSFRVSTVFASAGQHNVRIYDNQRNLIRESGGTPLDLAITAGRQYFVQIGSPSGTIDSYDLFIQKSGGSGAKSANLQGAVKRDHYFARPGANGEEECDHHGMANASDYLFATWEADQPAPMFETAAFSSVIGEAKRTDFAKQSVIVLQQTLATDRVFEKLTGRGSTASQEDGIGPDRIDIDPAGAADPFVLLP